MTLERSTVDKLRSRCDGSPFEMTALRNFSYGGRRLNRGDVFFTEQGRPKDALLLYAATNAAPVVQTTKPGQPRHPGAGRRAVK